MKAPAAALPPLLFLGAVGLYLARTPLGALPLDDGWIHMALARNLAAGDGYGLVPGEPVGASTAPLWTLLLAGLFRLTGPAPVAAQVLGVVLTLGALEILRRRFGLGAALLVALLPSTVWGAVSGLEVGLALLLVAAALSLRQGGKERCAVVAAGLAALARPEALLVALFLTLHRRPGETFRRLLLLALPLLPAVLLHLRLHGLPLPTTFYAKIHRSRNPAGGQGLFFCLERGRWGDLGALFVRWSFVHLGLYLQTLLRASPLVVLLLGAGAAAGVGRGAFLLPALLVGVPLGIGVLTPRPDFGAEDRYAVFLHPAVGALAAAGWGAFRAGPRLRLLAGVAVLAPLLVGLVDGSRRFRLEVDNTERVHVALARWVTAHLPPGALVAAHDVGALAFFARCRLLDLEGIATPEVLPRKGRPAALYAYLYERRPAYLIVAPNWYPELLRHEDVFRPVHAVGIPPEENLVLAGPVLVVYAARWPPP